MNDRGINPAAGHKDIRGAREELPANHNLELGPLATAGGINVAHVGGVGSALGEGAGREEKHAEKRKQEGRGVKWGNAEMLKY